MTFSERAGIKPRREVIQIESIDDQLRIALYNFCHDHFVNSWYTESGNLGGPGHVASRIVWTDFLYQPANEYSDSSQDFAHLLKDLIYTCQWNEVYDLIEFIENRTALGMLPTRLNELLAREMSGYRLKEKLIVPVSDPVEIEAIDEALAVAEPFAAARTHLVDALEKLSRRPDPDVRNAITEAVSAVESASRVVSKKHKANLGDALRVLEREGHVHPALKQAWLKLYGYTSDEHGLRHAMTEEPNIDFATAKYMVVSCAAFVNLLSALHSD
jgi:hypothetical protein